MGDKTNILTHFYIENKCLIKQSIPEEYTKDYLAWVESILKDNKNFLIKYEMNTKDG